MGCRIEQPIYKGLAFIELHILICLKFNYYVQVVYGGKGSNRTIDRIIKESSLIQVYQNVMTSIESVFLLGQQTVKHGEPDMSKTYTAMVDYFHSNGLFKERLGRSSVKEIVDAFEAGFDIIEEKGVEGELDADNGEPETLTHFDEDDLNNGIDID